MKNITGIKNQDFKYTVENVDQLVKVLRAVRYELDDLSKRVGEVITERTWQHLCGMIVDIDVALGDRTEEDAYGPQDEDY